LLILNGLPNVKVIYQSLTLKQLLHEITTLRKVVKYVFFIGHAHKLQEGG